MRFETRRKIVHITEGLIAAGLVYYDLFVVPAMAMLLAASTLISITFRRWRPEIIEELIDDLDREEHEGALPAQGSLFFLTGSILVVAFFEKNVALAAIATLTVGDSLSALVGAYLGRLENPLNSGKSIEGTLAGFLASTGANILFISFPAAFFVSAVAMIVESLEFTYRDWELDDNLTIPLSVGLAYLMFEAIVHI